MTSHLDRAEDAPPAPGLLQIWQARAGFLEERVMGSRNSLVALVAAGALILAGCSGATGAPGSSTGSSGPGGTAAGQPSQPGAESSDNTAQPTDDDTTGGHGTFTGSACDLLTTAEVEAAAGRTNVTATETKAGDFEGQSQCGYVSNGVVPVVIVTVLNDDGQVDPEAMLTMPESTPLQVNGAKAYWIPAAGFAAFVVKNGHIVLIAALGPSDATGDAKALGQALVQPVADRMP